MLLRRIRQMNPGEPLWKIVWWEFSRVLIYVWLVIFYRYRYFGVRKIPATGPVLLISNHQSVLDLAIIGVGLTHRHFHPMAKQSLFDNPKFAAIIRSYNAFPVAEDKADLKSIRTAIELLKAGHLVLIFPEGSRTPDGNIDKFLDGIMLLIRRAKPVVVPMAVEGPYDIWKIHQPKPKLFGRAAALIGEPITSEELLAMKGHDGLKLLRKRVIDCRHELREKMGLPKIPREDELPV